MDFVIQNIRKTTSGTCFSPNFTGDYRKITSDQSESIFHVKHELEQARIQRSNLFNILCTVTHYLTTKYADAILDDTCPDLLNLFAITENVFMHRLKNKKCWFLYDDGNNNTSDTLWNYLKIICSNLPNGASFQIVGSMDFKTSKAKGRAWIRLAMIEKRLQHYITEILKYRHYIKQFYYKGAFMLSQEAKSLPEIYKTINKINICLCVRDLKLDYRIDDTIDYTIMLNSADKVSLKSSQLSSPCMQHNSCECTSSNPEFERAINEKNINRCIVYRCSSCNNKAVINHPDADIQMEDHIEEESGIGLESHNSSNRFIENGDNPWKNLFYRMEEMYKITSAQKKKLEDLLEKSDQTVANLIRQNEILCKALKSFGYRNDMEKAKIDSVIYGLEHLLDNLSDIKDASERERHLSIPNYLLENKYRSEDKNLNAIFFTDTCKSLQNINNSSFNDLTFIENKNIGRNEHTDIKSLRDKETNVRLELFGYIKPDQMIRSHTFCNDKSHILAPSKTSFNDKHGSCSDDICMTKTLTEFDLSAVLESNRMDKFIDQKLKDIEYLYN